MSKKNEYGTLAESKDELHFIRILMVLGAIAGLQFGLGLAEANPQSIDKGTAIIFGAIGGSLVGAYVAKALSVAFQVLVVLAVLSYEIYRFMSFLELVSN